MSSSEPWRYEAAIETVETLIQSIESGELGLEEVVDQFQQASETLKTCQSFLREKQAQVDLVIEQLQDLPDNSTDAEEELDF